MFKSSRFIFFLKMVFFNEFLNELYPNLSKCNLDTRLRTKKISGSFCNLIKFNFFKKIKNKNDQI
jgi:hypothetical protein